MYAPRGFVWERHAPEAWQRRLRQAFGGRSDRVHYPLVAWIPGEPYQPVQRWGVFSVIPGRVLAQDTLMYPALTGRHPRARWAWDGEMFTGEPQGCTKQEWELFRVTGGWARLEWVIQGRHGGHKRRFSKTEEWLLKQGGRKDVKLPDPGDLCYASFDERVVQALAEVDALRKDYQRVLAIAKDGPEAKADVAGRRDAEMREFRTTLMDWLDRHIERCVRESNVQHWAMSDFQYNPETAGDLDAASEQFRYDKTF